MEKYLKLVEKELHRMKEFNNSNTIVSSMKTLMNYLVSIYKSLGDSDLDKKSKYQKQIKKILSNLVDVDKKVCTEIGILDSANFMMGHKESIQNLVNELKTESTFKIYKRKYF